MISAPPLNDECFTLNPFRNEDDSHFFENIPPCDLGELSLRGLIETLAEDNQQPTLEYDFLSLRLGDINVTAPVGLSDKALEEMNKVLEASKAIADTLSPKYRYNVGTISFHDSGSTRNTFPHLDGMDNRLIVVSAFPDNTQFAESKVRIPAISFKDVIDSGGDIQSRHTASIEEWSTVEEHALAFSGEGTIHRKPTVFTSAEYPLRALLRLTFIPNDAPLTLKEQLDTIQGQL